MRKLLFVAAVCGLLLPACVKVPTGPNVMVLPGSGKDFEQFQGDDAVCRRWALQQCGATVKSSTNDSAVAGAAVGTVVGAASGAAIGAAAGNAGAGAAVGSGVGLVGGTAVGADRAQGEEWSMQQRYDIAYMQCMYAKGNQIPIPKGSQLTHVPAAPSASPPPPDAPRRVPPPPAGSPPPPPPGSAW